MAYETGWGYRIHVSSRRVHIAEMTTKPTQAWTAARARESLCFLAGHAGERPILLRDHDTKFEGAFDAVLRENAVRVNKVGPQAPNLNAIAERWVQTVQHECLDHFVVFGEAHLWYLVERFLEHYHLQRGRLTLSVLRQCDDAARWPTSPRARFSVISTADGARLWLAIEETNST
jgi:hypothetical protein